MRIEAEGIREFPGDHGSKVRMEVLRTLGMRGGKASLETCSTECKGCSGGTWAYQQVVADGSASIAHVNSLGAAALSRAGSPEARSRMRTQLMGGPLSLVLKKGGSLVGTGRSSQGHMEALVTASLGPNSVASNIYHSLDKYL